MRPLTLRATILTSMLVLIIATVAATLVAVKQVIERAAMRDLHHELVRGRAVFASLAAERHTQLMRVTEVVAAEPRLRALANSDADRRTVVGVVEEVHQAVSTDIFVLIDGDGALILDMQDADEEGLDMLGNPVVADAFEHGSAAGVWVDDRSAYEVHVQRMSFGVQTIGAVALGRTLSDDTAATIHAQTGMSVVLLLDGVPIAVSPLPGARAMEPAALGEALGVVSPERVRAAPVALGDARFLAIADSFPAYRGEASLQYVLLRNIDLALEPAQQVTRILYIILIIAVLCALVVALLVTSRLSRPLDELCALAERIGHGELRARSRARGFAEVTQLATALNRMAAELQESRIQRAEKERLENELDIAAHIQTSILPPSVDLEGLEVAALMEPADEVGGDYYDVLATEDGGWLGIGDVAGHGLDAGLIMLMAQTSVATLAAAQPQYTPSQMAVILNQVLHANLKDRLDSDRHMTLCLLRYYAEGRLVVAGAHLEIIYLRARAEQCELLDTPGIWMGMIDDVAPMTFDTTYELEPGDLVILYTDGLIEARNRDGDMFGLDRVMDIVHAQRDRPVQEICRALFDTASKFAVARTDDITVLVMRYAGDQAAGSRK